MVDVGNVLSTVLISAPVAFMLGWILAKAVFRHRSLVGSDTPAATSGSDEVADTTAEIIADTTAEPQPESDELETERSRSEIQLLKEGIAERDHTIKELQTRLADQPAPLEDTPANASARETKLQQNITAMRDGLSTREKQLQELRTKVTARNAKHKQRFSLWRGRFKRAANQVRQQKLIISELREELKQRELRQRQLQEAATAAHTPPVAATSPARNYDELRALRGVGPAMQYKLNEQGVYGLQQIAEMSMNELLQLGDRLAINRGRMEKINWIQQARKLLKLPPADESTDSSSETADSAADISAVS